MLAPSRAVCKSRFWWTRSAQFVGDAELAKEGEPLDALEDVGGIGCPAGLPQPAEVRQPGVGTWGQQLIQPDPLPRD